MISIYVIFTALTTAALAKGSIECIFSETTGVQQCSGAVGQLLIFHLKTAANSGIRLTKDNEFIILKVSNHNVTVDKNYVNHQQSIADGTFTLGQAMKRHSGDYVLEEHGSDGALLKRANVHLEIKAPVSKPVVSQMCSSPEQMSISCSSEGEGVEFILTLDALLLIQTRGHSQSPSSRTAKMQLLTGKPSVSGVAISLQGQLTGNLTCQVWNNVSRDETVIQLKSCKDFSSFPVVTVAVTASVVTVFLLVAVRLCILKLHNKPRPTAVNRGNSEPEVIYTGVRVKSERVEDTEKTSPNSEPNQPNFVSD